MHAEPSMRTTAILLHLRHNRMEVRSQSQQVTFAFTVIVTSQPMSKLGQVAVVTSR
ncbi:hypothetical protein F7734_02135 [Scytonema sp. UIC 10036]|uniref:hypothetical protein n=1 Tax=Scytonema sp. UIC 10036 TaxID=2304196 RepID=UPI0012DA2C6E|nr:hypothetical protein [Scytonema sp. UIC 10036]MUG91350.1 hypothetical protein [Scytonema sp. UIC 10036]